MKPGFHWNWQERKLGGVHNPTDPRANCWTKILPNLKKNFKIFRPTIPISDNQNFKHNGWCNNHDCTNPFHYSPR